MLRVAIMLTYTSANWTGGINYLRNLITGISSDPKISLAPVMLVAPRSSEEIISQFPELEVIESYWAKRTLLVRAIRKASIFILGRDLVLERALSKHNIDVLTHSGSLGKRSRIKSIVWIPDFQHLHLPEFFSEKELKSRNRYYRSISETSTTVVLSSNDALQDFVAAYPQSAHKGRVLHFVGSMPSNEDSSTLKKLQEAYNLDGPFFHLPNQFWAHKNHILVLQALLILKARGIEVVVICTGAEHDRRQPGYFDELMMLRRQYGLEDYFRPLGVVPLADLAGLFRHSIAVINPSKFEGWSTSVEESKFLGKTIILSDIPVHREQAPEKGIFVSTSDALELADAMSECQSHWREFGEGDATCMMTDNLIEHLQEFGRNYEKIVFDSLGIDTREAACTTKLKYE